MRIFSSIEKRSDRLLFWGDNHTKGKMTERTVNRRALVSVSVCALLVVVAVVRLLSYFGGGVNGVIRHASMSFLAYEPSSYVNVQFFKILATPSVIALVYFLFRARNQGYRLRPGTIQHTGYRHIDFKSPWLRLILTSLVTLHWLPMEWYKFHTPDFYPWSPLENPAVNIVVLLCGQVIAFWGMKYLSFEPLFRVRSA